jgi:hypothetical protein
MTGRRCERQQSNASYRKKKTGLLRGESVRAKIAVMSAKAGIQYAAASQVRRSDMKRWANPTGNSGFALTSVPWRRFSHQEISAGMWRHRVTLWGFCIEAPSDRSWSAMTSIA